MAAAKKSHSGVAVDGLVLLKIMKHARTNPVEAQGFLLGMVSEDKSLLEVSNCYPLQPDDEEMGEEYLMTMIRNLRYVNTDHLQVGWYQVVAHGAFLTEVSILTQIDYQQMTPSSVILIYDPVRTAHGALSFQAYRITERFTSIFQDEEVTFERIRDEGLSFSDVLVEVPLTMRTSHLSRAMLEDLRVDLKQSETFDHLELSTHVVLEKNVRLIIDRVDELLNESQKFQNYQRNYLRQQQQRSLQLEKRKEENQVRQQQGLPPLADDDITSNPIYKPPPPFSCLSSLLISSQITRYCSQVSQFASQSFGKLYLAQGLQGHD
eukprot:m.229778 g.229778  ORF g.229778 m.229778 type:complete len:321 (+) comp17825_c0_seq1:29-991(+)